MSTTGEAELRRAYNWWKNITAAFDAGAAQCWEVVQAREELDSQVEQALGALLAELDRLRAAMGEDIETATGFSGHATEALK